MTNSSYTHPDAEQLCALQVGEASVPRPQQPALFENITHTGAEIDRQVEQIRWLMRREPMLEGREIRTAAPLCH